MDTLKTIGAGILGGIILLLGSLFVPHNQPTTKVGALSSPDIQSPWYCVGGVCIWNVSGSCGQPAGTIASSTLFAVQNPWAATSTLVYAHIYGTASAATSTDFLVGTSTTPAPAGLAVATSSLPARIIGITGLPSGTQFSSTAGVTFGSGTGYLAPSSGTYPTSQAQVDVGPNDYVVGFSTSTNPTNNGGITTSTLGVPQSCKYIFSFRRAVTNN